MESYDYVTSRTWRHGRLFEFLAHFQISQTVFAHLAFSRVALSLLAVELQLETLARVVLRKHRRHPVVGVKRVGLKRSTGSVWRRTRCFRSATTSKHVRSRVLVELAEGGGGIACSVGRAQTGRKTAGWGEGVESWGGEEWMAVGRRS